MNVVTLTRHTYHPFATMGELNFGSLTLHTIERPWLNNKPFESCIPEGVYEVVPYSSTKYPDSFEVVDVDGRTKILIHVANYAHDVSGCIGLGLGISSNTLMVTSSRDAMKLFNDVMSSEPFLLHIKQKVFS